MARDEHMQRATVTQGVFCFGTRVQGRELDSEELGSGEQAVQWALGPVR